jgi:hypothetical protein
MMVRAVGIERKAVLTARKLLIRLNANNAKYTGLAQLRYTPGTRGWRSIRHDKVLLPRQFWYLETVDVKLPSALLRAANLQESSGSEEAARLLALELYREDEDKVSLGRAAELCHTPLAGFVDFSRSVQFWTDSCCLVH